MNIFITSFYSRIFVLLLIIISSTVIFSNTDVYGETDYEIPEWIKINATWWMNDQLSDDEFVEAQQKLFRAIARLEPTEVE